LPVTSGRQKKDERGQLAFMVRSDDVCMTPFDEIAAAIDAERAAWLAVKDHLPGTEGHDPRLWDAWLGAMRRCQQARASSSHPHADAGTPSPMPPRDDTSPPGWH
jgi:hypothetical protein